MSDTKDLFISGWKTAVIDVRRRIMKKLLIITSMAVLSICCSTAVSADESPVPAGVMDSLPKDNMNWFDKYEAAIKEAGAEEKQATLPDGRVINYGEVKNDKPALLLIHGQQSIW